MKMGKKILVVWQVIPEDIRFYLFEEDKLTEEEVINIKKAHNEIANIGDDENAGWLCDFLENCKENLVDDSKKPMNIIGDITVITTGFML